MDLQAFKDNLALSLFGMTKATAVQKGICISCKLPITELAKTKQDMDEHKTSGLCPKCFEENTNV